MNKLLISQIEAEILAIAVEEAGLSHTRASKIISAIHIAQRALHWANMSDSEMRLKCGEMTAQEIRSIKAVLNNILNQDA